MSTVSPTSFGSFPAATVPPATFTLEEYEHMVACGAFSGEHEKKVELLWGRISEMPPIGESHEDRNDRIANWSVRVTIGQPIHIRNQNSIRLPGSSSKPQPDICWVRERDYSTRAPHPDDILLVIEVADSSLERDRIGKLTAYAQAAIPEYWIINLVEQQVEVYRQPKGLEYAEKRNHQGDDIVTPLALPSIKVTARQLISTSLS